VRSVGVVAVLVVVVLFGAAVPAAGQVRATELACPRERVPAAGYTDVPAGDNHAAAIDCMTWWEVALGGGDGRYRPAADVTRGQMATFIARLVDRSIRPLPEGRGAFDDIDGTVHRDAIERLAAADIVAGVSDRRFEPERRVSRAQMATFIARTWSWVDGRHLPPGPDAFDDDAGDTHEANIDAIAAVGIAGGVAPRAYAPNDPVRRGQMASFLARTADLLTAAAYAAPPRPQGPTVDAATFNLAGWTGNRGGPAPADTVVAMVRRAEALPAAVALTEVCSSGDPGAPGQWELVVRELAGLGYHGVHAPSLTGLRESHGFPGACDDFGNGILLRGPVEWTATLTFEAQDFGTSRFEELRNVVCVTGATPQGRLGACSTHLAPRDVAREQAGEALRWVSERVSGVPRLVGGDLNLVPNDAALDGWYTFGHEADGSRRDGGYVATTERRVKVDYVFADRARFPEGAVARVTAVPTSDHHWLEGFFPVP
jgi:endonuclease/exonuclease/phosphatase family metal-dependent hydrolase